MVNWKNLTVDCNMNSVSNSTLSSNTILMLSLISKSVEKGWLGITKLQKLSFLTEYDLAKNSKRAFDYEFFMYDHGPMSRGVYQDYETLLNDKLIIEDEDGISLSKLGQDVNEQFKEIIPKEIRSTMQKITRRFAPMKTAKLVKTVHNMKRRLPDGTIERIDDIDKNCVVLPKPLVTIFNIGKGYLETFRILSDKSLREAIREARRNGSKSKPYEPLVSS